MRQRLKLAIMKQDAFYALANSLLLLPLLKHNSCTCLGFRLIIYWIAVFDDTVEHTQEILGRSRPKEKEVPNSGTEKRSIFIFRLIQQGPLRSISSISGSVHTVATLWPVYVIARECYLNHEGKAIHGSSISVEGTKSTIFGITLPPITLTANFFGMMFAKLGVRTVRLWKDWCVTLPYICILSLGTLVYVHRYKQLII